LVQASKTQAAIPVEPYLFDETDVVFLLSQYASQNYVLYYKALAAAHISYFDIVLMN
jgi:hypothetical protein